MGGADARRETTSSIRHGRTARVEPEKRLPSKSMSEPTAPPVLLTGTTGYVGGYLLESLRAAGRPVRCITRRPRALARYEGDGVEVVEADVMDREAIVRAMTGAKTAVYLVHSMARLSVYRELDRQLASSFA